ncbi:site-specific DNA-methyltransferase [Azospirillum canadense]|uniref:site-specific DNA-methyltransferase n=1 Tax=Azospirillum canadense TaxID=403962 RepID=UPI0022279EB5|nr:site-specific DNA-methyltransferase [Azospirillum canadense]MCW2240723.1 site-specific DNA-methyltransferase (cytosine-N4-specific) [Azospirillum canadense]
MPRDDVPPASQPAAPSAAAIAARRRRIQRGQNQETAARDALPSRPRGLQSLLAFPLLQALDDAGGTARPCDIYEQIADRLAMPTEARSATRTCANGRAYNHLQQQIRWTRQTAKARGLIVDAGRGLWQLADPAYAKLGRIRRGAVYLAWSTDLGIGLWAHAEDAASEIAPGSVQLVLSSPVYPIQSGRQYGAMTPAIWLDWMSRLTRLWADLITDDGIIVLNVADVHIPGIPAMSPYLYRYMLDAIENIGLYEQQPDYWLNPTKLGNIQWTAKSRYIPKGAIEHVKFLSRSPFPKRTVDNILVPRKSTPDRVAADRVRSKERRPSGYDINSAAFHANDEAIPNNLLIAGGVPASDTYSRRCRAAGLPIHPARFPKALAERVILQTTDPGDLCYDPMAGSATVAEVAQALGRRAIVSEPMLAYVEGQRVRLDRDPSFRNHLPDHVSTLIRCPADPRDRS